MLPNLPQMELRLVSLAPMLLLLLLPLLLLRLFLHSPQTPLLLLNRWCRHRGVPSSSHYRPPPLHSVSQQYTFEDLLVQNEEAKAGGGVGGVGEGEKGKGISRYSRKRK